MCLLYVVILACVRLILDAHGDTLAVLPRTISVTTLPHVLKLSVKLLLGAQLRVLLLALGVVLVFHQRSVVPCRG